MKSIGIIMILASILADVDASRIIREIGAAAAFPVTMWGVVQTCRRIRDEDPCERQDGCKWENNKCFAPGWLGHKQLYEDRGLKCRDLLMEDECSATKTCKWKNGKCEVSRVLAVYHSFSRKNDKELDELLYRKDLAASTASQDDDAEQAVHDPKGADQEEKEADQEEKEADQEEKEADQEEKEADQGLEQDFKEPGEDGQGQGNAVQKPEQADQEPEQDVQYAKQAAADKSMFKCAGDYCYSWISPWLRPKPVQTQDKPPATA